MRLEPIGHKEAKAFLAIPEVWRLTAGSLDPTDYAIPADTMLVGARDDSGTLMSLSVLHPWRTGLKLHYHVLRRFRRQWARPVLVAIQDGAARAGVPLYAVIPWRCRPVINFALNMGFQSVDQMSDSEVLRWDS